MDKNCVKVGECTGMYRVNGNHLHIINIEQWPATIVSVYILEFVRDHQKTGTHPWSLEAIQCRMAKEDVALTAAQMVRAEEDAKKAEPGVSPPMRIEATRIRISCAVGQQ